MQEDAFDAPLILVPHSDDEWIGPYSILNKAAHNSKCVYFNLFGNDYSETNRSIRNAEILASSRFWGFELINNIDCDSRSLSRLLTQHSHIFVPSPYDWHPEHRKVFQTLYHSLNLLSENELHSKKIYYYCVSVPHMPHEFVYYVPLSESDINNKWNNFNKIYRSQSFMPALRYKLNLRLVPSKCGYAAQFYVLADINRIKMDYEITMDKSITSKLDTLFYKINNLFKIRSFSLR